MPTIQLQFTHHFFKLLKLTVKGNILQVRFRNISNWLDPWPTLQVQALTPMTGRTKSKTY